MLSRALVLLAAAAIGSTNAFSVQPMGITRASTQLRMVSKLGSDTAAPPSQQWGIRIGLLHEVCSPRGIDF